MRGEWVTPRGDGYHPPVFIRLEFRLADGSDPILGTSGQIRIGVYPNALTETVFVSDVPIQGKRIFEADEVDSWRFVEGEER